MKIAVIGTGAVGGYYGILLAKHGFDVHFLLNSDFEHVRQNGLFLNSINGNVALKRVNAYSDVEDMPRCDLGIIALKTTSNEILNTILPHAVKPDAMLVMLQNGLGIERQVLEILPDATVIGGLCFLCSNKTGPGYINHLDYGSVRLGQYSPNERPAGITDALVAVCEIFRKSSIAVEMTGDLGMARWEKLVWNMPFNGLSVILDSDTGNLVSSPFARSILREIMIEVTGAARSCEHDISDDFCEKMISATMKMVAYQPSMKLDYDAKRPLEIDTIYRNPIQKAAQSGYDMVKSRIIMNQLAYLDCNNRDG